MATSAPECEFAFAIEEAVETVAALEDEYDVGRLHTGLKPQAHSIWRNEGPFSFSDERSRWAVRYGKVAWIETLFMAFHLCHRRS